MLSEMAHLNAPLETDFTQFLSRTTADPDLHMRFLNLLSLLEHMGSRKIMLSQMKGILTQDILKHLAEETRHAFFFKREAEKLAGRPLEGYPEADTMCAPAGRFYFGRLDSGLTQPLPGSVHRETGYLWVSLIVELRAIWVYRRYQKALLDAGLPLSIKGIIAEEDRHLEDMVKRLDEIGFDSEGALPRAVALEKKLFERLMSALITATA